MDFTEYLRTATNLAIANKAGDLDFFVKLCDRGVRCNWEILDPKQFLAAYHWGVATVGRRVAVLEKSYWPSQVTLFRRHNPARIVADRDAILAEWEREKRFLRLGAVKAVLHTAELVNRSWADFKDEYLVLPENPDTESLQDWSVAQCALDRLPMVGPAVALFLIRNLYGARVFKPDVNICAIANHFFPQAADRIGAMTEAVKKAWARVCTDRRLLPVHLGKVDYILWWYRQETGLPAASASTPC